MSESMESAPVPGAPDTGGDDLAAGWVGEDEDETVDSPRATRYYHDPDGSKWRRREEWIAEQMGEYEFEPPLSSRYYFELVYDNEIAPEVTEWELLMEKGFSFPPPDELDDAQITQKLDELLDELLNMHVQVEFVSTQCERMLYTELVTRCLREPTPERPLIKGSATVIDLLPYDEDFDSEDLGDEDGGET